MASNDLNIGGALKTAFQIRKKKKEASEKNAMKIDGLKVMLSTEITLRSKEEGKPAQKFREYILEDGTTRRELLGDTKKPDYVIDLEAGIHKLIPQEYDVNKRRWRPIGSFERQNGRQKESSWIGKGGEVCVVTYNVWFSEVNQKERCHALLEILEQKDPDIVCLQEVTPFFLSILARNEWIRSTFLISDAIGTTLRGSELQYGVIMLVRKTQFEVTMIMYTPPSNMNRRPLVTTIVTPSFRLQIATMHLESMNSTRLRSIQQKEVFSVLNDNISEAETFNIFCGDFNYNANEETEESKAVPENYVDAWTMIHGVSLNSDSFTYPGIGRIDRVLYDTLNGQLKCKHIEHLGTASIPGLLKKDISEARPSDHFGLYAVFKIC